MLQSRSSPRETPTFLAANHSHFELAQSMYSHVFEALCWSRNDLGPLRKCRDQASLSFRSLSMQTTCTVMRQTQDISFHLHLHGTSTRHNPLLQPPSDPVLLNLPHFIILIQNGGENAGGCDMQSTACCSCHYNVIRTPQHSSAAIASCSYMP